MNTYQLFRTTELSSLHNDLYLVYSQEGASFKDLPLPVITIYMPPSVFINRLYQHVQEQPSLVNITYKLTGR